MSCTSCLRGGCKICKGGAIEKLPLVDINHIYYNVNFDNPPSLLKPIQARFEENRVQPLIDNPSDFYLTIARFELIADYIPLGVIEISDPPYGTYLWITLGYSNSGSPISYYPKQVIYHPYNNLPTSDEGYKYFYYYQQLLDSINDAIEKSFTDLTTANPTILSNYPGLLPPKFIYSPKDKLIILYIQNLFPWFTQFDSDGSPIVTGSGSTGERIFFFMNEYTLNYLDAFPVYTFHSVPPFVLDPLYQHLFIIKNRSESPFGYYPGGSQITDTQGSETFSVNPPWFAIPQEYSMFYLWHSITGIVFLSNTLQIQQEYVPVITEGDRNSGAISFRPILTDFKPEVDEPGSPRKSMQYYPTGPYRLINLTSTDPLRKIDISVWWQDYSGKLYPFFITNGNMNTIKMLFIKKSAITADFIA